MYILYNAFFPSKLYSTYNVKLRENCIFTPKTLNPAVQYCRSLRNELNPVWRISQPISQRLFPSIGSALIRSQVARVWERSFLGAAGVISVVAAAVGAAAAAAAATAEITA